MLLSVARYEFRYQVWSAHGLVSFAVLFGLGSLLTANGGEFQTFAAGGNINSNAPYALTRVLIIMGIFTIFAVPSFLGGAVLKDVDNRFDGILFSMPMRERDYVLGRFIGSFFALMTAFAGAPLGLLLGTFWPWADTEFLGPMRIDHYLIIYFGFVAPYLLAASAIIFTAAIATRKMVYANLMAIGLLVFYLIVSGSDTLPPILDPSMFKIFEARTDYWTAVERNRDLISFDGVVLMNRLIWTGIAGAFICLSLTVFSFRRLAQKSRSRGQPDLVAETHSIPQKQVAIRRAPVWTKTTPFWQFLYRTKFEILSVLHSWPFLILMTLSFFLLTTSLFDREVMYGVNAYPITRLMVGEISSLVLPLLAVLVFYSADIMDREGHARIKTVIGATPAPNWSFIASKLIALTTVMFAILLLGCCVAIGLQTLSGYTQYEFGLYLERGLFYLIMPFLCLAVLACFFQVVAGKRYIGMIFFGAFIGLTILGADVFGIEHPLLSFGLPGISVPLSDMNGSGRFIAAGYWIRAYWGAIAALLLVATYQLWDRGISQPLPHRLLGAMRSRTPIFTGQAFVLLIITGAIGGYIFYNTNVLNIYQTRSDRNDLRERYERDYAQYLTLPMPRTVSIKNHVDIYPYQRRVKTRSTHTLMNKTDASIEVVSLVFPREVEVSQLSVEGAKLAQADEALNYYIFHLTKPMHPGEQLPLTFETLIKQEGFRHSRPDVSLVRNGTFIRNTQITPYIGFDPDGMIQDSDERIARGLPPLPRRPRLEDSEQYTNNSARQDSDFITFKTTVSTIEGQYAIAPGELKNDWVDDGRHYFDYEMDAPIRNFYSYLSAEYEVVRDQWNDVDIEIFHHKTHAYNLDRMIAGVQDSLTYFSDAFSPYQYKQLRIVEFPSYREFAQSFPGTIPYSEGLGFVADVGSRSIDVPYYVTAHEVAHQWWGHQVTAANVQGNSFIHETLSQYSALLVMEQKYGKHHIRQFLSYELDKYLESRSDEADGELPLFRVENQQYIHYRKGALIMYALRDYLGEEVVNNALRRLIELRAYQSDPYATSIDFLDILKEEAGQEFNSLIEDFFERITLYDLALDASNVVPLSDGRFRVTLDVRTAKLYADEDGNETAAPFDISVDIGLFLKRPDDPAFGAEDVIALNKRSVADGTSTIEIIVDQRPLFAGIDPYSKLIDREAGDNIGLVQFVTEP